MHRAQAVSSAVGVLRLIAVVVVCSSRTSPQLITLFLNGLLLWWETILAVEDLEDELLNVLYFDVLGSCSTDSDSFMGMCDCSKHKYFPAQRPGRRRSRCGKVSLDGRGDEG